MFNIIHDNIYLIHVATNNNFLREKKQARNSVNEKTHLHDREEIFLELGHYNKEPKTLLIIEPVPHPKYIEQLIYTLIRQNKCSRKFSKSQMP